jgi:hypothetical protein
MRLAGVPDDRGHVRRGLGKLPPFAVQDVAPDRFRGRTVALYDIVMSLFGLSLGAVLIAGAATRTFVEGAALGVAMAMIAAW